MRGTALLVAGVVLVGSVGVAHANRLFVVTSDVPAYPAQTILDGEHVLTIPAGRSVLVLRPDGTERTLTAAENGRPVRAILETVAEAPWWQRMLDTVRGGGAQPKQGSTRSMTVSAADYATVAGQRSGTVCALGSAGPELQRPATAAQRALTVEIEGPSGTKSTTTFAANAPRAQWPTDQTAAGTYRVRPANQPPFEVTVKALPPATGLAQVRALGAAGCERQAADVLRTAAR